MFAIIAIPDFLPTQETYEKAFVHRYILYLGRM